MSVGMKTGLVWIIWSDEISVGPRVEQKHLQCFRGHGASLSLSLSATVTLPSDSLNRSTKWELTKLATNRQIVASYSFTANSWISSGACAFRPGVLLPNLAAFLLGPEPADQRCEQLGATLSMVVNPYNHGY